MTLKELRAQLDRLSISLAETGIEAEELPIFIFDGLMPAKPAEHAVFLEEASAFDKPDRIVISVDVSRQK